MEDLYSNSIEQKWLEMDLLNYCSVNLASVCCKVLEHVIVSLLVDYLESKGLLSVYQFGFHKGKSVEDQLLVTYGEVVVLVDKGLVVDMFFFRFL